MACRNRMTVESFRVSKFRVTESKPYMFTDPATVWVYFKRTLSDGSVYRGVLSLVLLDGYMTDGASTKWPVSLLVPNWRKGDDRYNAAPVTHDALYMMKGVVPGLSDDESPMELSREECDDILRGMWRCWGMKRFLAGCADKGVELFAGGKSHWGNDGYGVKGRAYARWRLRTTEEI